MKILALEKEKTTNLRYLLTLVCFVALQAFTQDIAIGQWRTHLPYYNVKSISEGENKIWCATVADLFTYDLVEGSIEKKSKVSGLSGVGIVFLKYHTEKEALFIAYEDGNIDIVKDDEVINIPSIKEKIIAGDKAFNSVNFNGDYAYISTNMGIVVVDMVNFQIKETYIIGDDGGTVNVFSTAVSKGKIYAATREGIKEGDLDGEANLIDFNFWTKHSYDKGLVPRIADDIVVNKDTLFMLTLDSVFKYNGISWEYVYSRKAAGYDFVGLDVSNEVLIIYEELDTTTENLKYSYTTRENGTIVNHTFEDETIFPQVLYDTHQSSGREWVASQNFGLSIKASDGLSTIIPDGPRSVACHSMYSDNGILWVNPGGYDASWGYKHLRTGMYRFMENDWELVQPESISHILDYVRTIRDQQTGHWYFGSYHHGLVEYFEGAVVAVHDDSTSLQTLYPNGPYLVNGMAFDSKNNLWVSNTGVGGSSPISVKTTDGDWFAYKPSGDAKEMSWTAEMVIDNSDQKWVIVKNEGIMVFNDGGTLDDDSDDRWGMMKAGDGQGGLPSLHVNTLALDEDGEIWVGTSEGLAVIYCPESFFTESSCEAQQILVEYDGYTGHLFEEDNVKSIEIDGANRKWIGTENGVWLMSEDGTEELYSFTESNSPLLSNDILDIEVLGETGEVFFATDLGIVSYKSTSTEGKYIQDKDVLVYPNPVREDYTGIIAIRGLVDDAQVKITDVKGQLVYQTIALGGQAIWDGNLIDGERASTGVYLVWSSNNDGEQTHVAKILMIN